MNNYDVFQRAVWMRVTRQEEGVYQKFIAKVLEWSEDRVRRLERGDPRVTITDEQVQKVCEVLRRPVPEWARMTDAKGLSSLMRPSQKGVIHVVTRPNVTHSMTATGDITESTDPKTYMAGYKKQQEDAYYALREAAKLTVKKLAAEGKIEITVKDGEPKVEYFTTPEECKLLTKFFRHDRNGGYNTKYGGRYHPDEHGYYAKSEKYFRAHKAWLRECVPSDGYLMTQLGDVELEIQAAKMRGA